MRNYKRRKKIILVIFIAILLKIRFYTKIGVKCKTTSTCKEVIPNKDTNQHHERTAKQPQQGTKSSEQGICIGK